MKLFDQLRQRKNIKMNKWDYLALTISSAFFAVLSFCNMGRWSVWFDEAFGLYLLRSNYFDVAQLTSYDVHPPLYYWVLKFWTSIFGTSEYGARSLSLVLFIVALVFIYLLVRRLFGQKAAIVTALLFACTPLLLRYSVEARMYGMTTAIIAASTYTLVSAMDKPKRYKWVIYGLLVALGLWTHYFTALAFAAQWVWRFIAVRKGTIQNSLKLFFSKGFTVSILVTAVAYLPWLYFGIKQMIGVQASGFWISPIVPASPFNFVSDTLLYRVGGEANGWFAVLLWVIIICVGILVFKTCWQLKGEQKVNYQLLLIMALVPLLLLIAASLPPLRPALVDRYLMPSVAFLVALIGVTISLHIGTRKKWHKLPAATLGLVLVAMVTGIVYVYQIGNFNKDGNDPLPIWPVMQKVYADTKLNEPILVSSVTRYYEVAYYEDRAPVGSGVFFEAADSLTWGSYQPLRGSMPAKVYDTVEFAKKNGGTIWYVGDWTKEGEPALPKTGTWEVLREVHADTTPNNRSDIRAVELQLVSAE